MRACEHRADEAKRQLWLALREAFSPPLDAEDLYTLSADLDEVLNAAKDLVREMEVMDMQPDEPVHEMVVLVAGAVGHLADAFDHLDAHGDATEHADAAIKSRRGIEHAYRRAMSALLQVEDLHEVIGRRETTGGSRGSATWCTRWPSASGTRSVKESAPAVKRGRRMEHFDVIVVGAGISGIGAAYHLQSKCPTKSYVILEGRDEIGGTWDLFRYPGVRSDSDMHTLGYNFKPWTARRPSPTDPRSWPTCTRPRREFGIDRHIRFGTARDRGPMVERDGRLDGRDTRRRRSRRRRARLDDVQLPVRVRGLLQLRDGYTPEFPGRDRFGGRVVHPQAWPEDLDYPASGWW